MSTITLANVVYVSESVADDTIPTHNYDDMIDIDEDEDMDAWIQRIAAEWDDMPSEIKEKIVASVEKEIGDVSKVSDEFFDGELIPEEDIMTPDDELYEASSQSQPSLDPAVSVLFDKVASKHAPIAVLPNQYYVYDKWLDEWDWDAVIYLTPEEYNSVESLVTKSPVQDDQDVIACWLNAEGYSQYVQYKRSVDPDDKMMSEAATDLNGNEVYDFAAGRKYAENASDESLMYVRQDLINVITVQEKSNKLGHRTPKLGYYWDEYWTVADEIARRMKKGVKFDLKPWSLDGSNVDEKLNELGN